jgi:acyl carrier protein
MDDLQARLTKCFLAVFPELTEGQVTSASPSTVTGWDSVATLNLLTVIEEEFNMEIDFVDVMEDLSYSQIAAYLQKRVESRTAAS